MKAADRTSRNKRSVWTVATQPYPGAHFATMPPKLAEPCILAGTSERGQCPACRTPWVRVVEREPMVIRNGPKAGGYGSRTTDSLSGTMVEPPSTRTVGWEPSCACGLDPIPDVVIDPFGGSGTTGMVADRLGRNSILIELNPTYAADARRRIVGDAPLFAAAEVR